MSTRRFEYSDEKSNKFWEISVDGSEHTVCYGRIGTDGQSKTKSFDDAEAAQKDAEKLIKSKTKKGYVEVATDTSDTAETADTADTPAAKLRALLQGLCKTEADEAILNNLCDHCTDVTDDTLFFEEDGYDWEVEYAAGTKVIHHPSVPKSFANIMGVVSLLVWDAGGPEAGYAVDSDNGQSEADEWLFDEWAHDDEEAANELLEANGGETPGASFCAGQNGLFFDPTNTLSNGEPGLAFLSHEGGGWEFCESVKDCDYGQILLRLLSDAMVSTSHVEEAYF